MIRIALLLATLTAVALAVVALFSAGDGTGTASAGNGGMDAMSVDADPTGNDATTLGERNDCAEVSAGDSVDVDVTALNIPAGNPMIAFNFRLLYDEANITISAENSVFLIASAAGSNLLSAGDAVPDVDGNFLVTTVDLEAETAAESGSGVLSRITVDVDPAAPAGGYLLQLTEAAHVDDTNTVHAPGVINAAQLAVDVTCDSLPPPPTPGPEFLQGDIDCDGDVDAVDALQLLRHVAGLGANQAAGCPGVGEQVGDFPFGDIDCDGDVDAVDALQILRHVAGLGANQGAGCQPVGQ